MKSKYLRDIGCEYNYDDDERKEKFDEEREEYGISSRDTWALDITFVEFIYISFMMYNEVNIVNTHFHKFEIDGKEWDMQKAIDYIIETSKTHLIQMEKNFIDTDPCLPHKFYEVLEAVMPLMWW